MRANSRILVCSALLLSLLVPCQLHAQVVQTGKVIGNVMVTGSGFPVYPVLVSLELRGSPIASAYTDDQGRFGFPNLVGGLYTVRITDDSYEPASQTTNVDPSTAAINFVQITLTRRANAKKDSLPGRVAGSNPFLIDPAEYYSHFPKKTVKEFQKGVDADRKGNPGEAIEHYQKALEYSPEFYPAHNNLGVDYLSRQNFDAAQSEFEAALKANQNDGQAYFNLANVFLLTRHYEQAQGKIEQGLQRRPDSAFGRFLEGSVYARTGKAELAEKSLQSALQLDPKMSQAHLQLVNLYLEQKRTSDAITQLETYLKAFPDSPFSPKARDLLKRLQSDAPAASKSSVPR
jgi:tetratricopeptide (TPR) repeat protein